MFKPTKFNTIAKFYEYTNKHEWVLVNEGKDLNAYEREEGATYWETYVTPSGRTVYVLLSEDAVISTSSE